MYTIYTNSEYEAANRLRVELGIQESTFQEVLKRGGIEPKLSILATDIMNGVVQFFVDLLAQAQTEFERAIDELIDLNFEYDSDAVKWKIVDEYITRVLDSLHRWFQTVQKIGERAYLEGFFDKVNDITTKKLTAEMLLELNFPGSIRMDRVEKARAYAFILQAMQEDYTSRVKVIEPEWFDQLTACYDIIRDDITPGLMPDVDEEEVQEHYLRMKEIVEKETPFVG